jgi:hypothetical protein
MASDRPDELDPMKVADGMLNDNDDLNREGKKDHATSMVQAVVDQGRWYYYHLSTP